MKKAVRNLVRKRKGRPRAGSRRRKAKMAKKMSQMRPAVRTARRGLADQKMEAVAKKGKREKRKNWRSVRPGKLKPQKDCLRAAARLRGRERRRARSRKMKASKRVASKRTSQMRGRESSKFMEWSPPREMRG